MTKAPTIPARRTVFMLAIAVILAASVFGTGIWIGGGGLRFLNAPTPETIYITPEPGSSQIADAGTPTPSIELSPSSAESASPSAVATPTAAPTPAPTLRPPTPTPARPNLTVTDFASNVGFCAEGGTAVARIVNNGPGAMPRTAAVRLTDTYDNGHITYQGELNVPALAAGAFHNVTWPVTIEFGCNKNHVFTVEIDPAHALAESNEDDNRYQVEHFVHSARPNLTVTSISVGAAHPTCLNLFKVTVTISNTGPVSSGRYFTLRVVDRVGTTTVDETGESVAPIPAHSSVAVVVWIMVDSHCPGTHLLVATADYVDFIDESNESDNSRSLSYQVGS
jgi:hypothetical protein